MFDTKRLLDQFLGAGGAQGGTASGDIVKRGRDYLQSNAGGLAGGAAAGGLVALLLGTKGGRKFTSKAATYGGMALVAGLAYKAYRDWQSGGGTPYQPGQRAQGTEPQVLPPPSDSSFSPERMPGGETELGLKLLTAMIAAAKADGHIDAQEQSRIFDKLDHLDLDAEAKAFVMDELRAPLDIERVVKGAETPEEALEIYAASRLSIDPDHPAEKAYLQMLAARLEIEPGLVAEVDRAVEEAQGSGQSF